MQLIRLTTVHPALVHFTIGALPMIVIAYGVAARQRSERWTFAGDATLVITAVLTVATATFGLVANAIVGWPGGLSLWRWLHLALGAASAGALVVFAGVRLWRRERVRTSGTGTFAAAIAIAVLVFATGWIGGEVLVFRSGIAVRAAGDGSLAPPAVKRRAPKNLVDAMDRLRASWAAAETRMSRMIVQSPSRADFAALEGNARQLTDLADWIALEGPKHLANPNTPSHHHEDQESEHHHEDQDEGMTAGQHLALMARELGADTVALERAARVRDIAAAAGALGKIQAGCADCHSEMRWH